MNTSRLVKATMVALTIMALGACGGGGGGGSSAPPPVTPPPPPPPTGGISGNGFAFGPVTTFGSVVVNGVHYDTSNTSFTFDDNPSQESDLDIGDIVLVKGTIDDDGLNGTAESVSSDDEVTGPIGSIDTDLGQLVVLSQLIQVGPETSFEDTVSLETLVVGDIVEVHGYFKVDDPDGIDIAATRIENKSSSGLDDDEVHGFVDNLDGTDGILTFTIGSLIVDYTNALLDDSFPNGMISDGDFVEVKGTSSIIGGDLTLTAVSVELEEIGISGEDGDHFEVEGFITSFVSVTDFDVAGFPVTTNASTVIEGGDPADLRLNIKVEVEGALDAFNVLVADKVDIRRSKAVRVVGLVQDEDPLTVAGIVIRTDGLTRFEDKTDADQTPLKVIHIMVNEYLEVRGAEVSDELEDMSTVLATIFERDDPDSRTEIQGFVETVTDPILTILGVDIDTSGASFRGLNGSSLTAEQFFAIDRVGSLVKVRSETPVVNSFSATEVQLEREL